MKNVILAATVVGALCGTVNAAEVSGTVGFTSDYRFRGISQTGGDPALQGSLDVAFDNGVYAGLWGSNIDYGDDAHLELDYYIGHSASISDELEYDASIVYYQYPGDDADSNYAEVFLGLNYKSFSFLYAIANDAEDSSLYGQYVALDYSNDVSEVISLNLHAGYSFGDAFEPDEEYSDYSIGISGSFQGLDLAADYITTDADTVSSGIERNDDTIVFSVSRSF
ncbi:TorF family putative porin [Amphritea sp. HPY]|uniref:TorF family putative porin n=1 Tax=Amphritea sp. HPY TaxID=3421652 RepID=UPI003D7D8662